MTGNSSSSWRWHTIWMPSKSLQFHRKMALFCCAMRTQFLRNCQEGEQASNSKDNYCLFRNVCRASKHYFVRTYIYILMPKVHKLLFWQIILVELFSFDIAFVSSDSWMTTKKSLCLLLLSIETRSTLQQIQLSAVKTDSLFRQDHVIRQLSVKVN